MPDKPMRRILSTYLWVQQKLTTALLDEIDRAGLNGVEIFCSSAHFDYRATEFVRETADWFAGHQLKLHSLHGPTSRDFRPGREGGGSPVSLSDPERIRRLDAVDEVKRAIDVAEQVPFEIMVLHVATARDETDQRRWDAAFTSLEHLVLFARQRGVTLALENTPGEMATPANLRHFLEDTRLPGLRLCFDSGHAHMDTGALQGLEVMRGLAVTTHLHDNHGEKDEHLLPFEGTIEWDKLMKAMPAELPCAIELREQAGQPRPSFDAIRAAFDKLEGARGDS
jgi:sugar phosphate isomerase/epimerase